MSKRKERIIFRSGQSRGRGGNDKDFIMGEGDGNGRVTDHLIGADQKIPA